MHVLATLMDWLDARRRRSRVAMPYDHSARLFVRKLEERQVLSVTAAVVHGVLDIHVTNANQSVALSVDHSGHLIVDGSIGGQANQHLVLDTGSFSAIHITSDASSNQSLIFDGAQLLQISGQVTVDGGFSNIVVDGSLQAGGISLSATDISLSTSASLTSFGAAISINAADDITMADGSSLHSSHQEIQLVAQDAISVGSNAWIHDSGGTVTVDAGIHGSLTFSGTADVSNSESGQTAGTVHLLGELVTLDAGARILADGDVGGGTVLIGGDHGGNNPDIHNSWDTTVGSDVVIDANALTSGAGGTVVVWSDNITLFQGTIDARGGMLSGNGGSAEVSGGELGMTGFVNLLAAHGNAGTLLLDPGSVDIIHGSASTTPPVTLDVFTDGYINQWLAGGSVSIDTLNSKNGGSEVLTVESNAVISWNNSNPLSLIGNASNSSVIIDGTITNTAAARLTLTGGMIDIENAISLTTGIVVINVSASATEGANGTIAASGFFLGGTGTSTLLNPNNDIGTFAIAFSGDAALSDNNGFTIGTVSGRAGALVSGSLTLQTTGTINQASGTAGTILCTDLQLLGTGAGTYTLLNAGNGIGTLAANTQGSISIADYGDCAIGTVTSGGLSTSGINTTGVVTLNVDSGTLTQSAPIVASSLLLMGQDALNLTDTGNQVSTLAAKTTDGAINFFDSVNLVIGSVNSTSGITTGGNGQDTLSIQTATGCTITVDNPINVLDANVTFDAGGAVTQLTTGTITTSVLTLQGAGSENLLTAGNHITNLQANTTGDIGYNDVSGFTVAGVTTTGTLTLQSGGMVDENYAPISASGVDLLGSGSYMLTITGNSIGTLSANTTGSVNVFDSTNLVVGTISSFVTTSGISTGGHDVVLQTATGASLTVNDAISSGNATLTTGANLLLQTATSNVTGTGVVSVTAADGSITGLGTLTGSSVALSAANGINNGIGGGLLTNTASISADDTAGIGINIANSHATMTTVTSLTTNGADMKFVQSGGGNLSFTGAITSGSPLVNGGNIFLENSVAGSLLTLSGTLSSGAGSGGGLTLAGTSLNSTNSLIIGAGNITLIGGAPDTIVNSNFQLSGSITFDAIRDVIIGGVIGTINNPNANVTLMGGYNFVTNTFNTTGGVEILASGRVTSSGYVTISGANLFAASNGVPDSVWVVANGTNDQVLAAGNINISSNSSAPAGANVVIDGQIHSTSGNITVNATKAIQVESSVTADSGNIEFLSNVTLTGNAVITANQNVTFDSSIDADSTANNRTLLVNAGVTTAFDGPVGGSGALLSLTTAATGTTDVNGGTVNATTVDFKNDVTLTANTTITGTAVTFEKTVNDQTANAYSLLVNASGTTTFGGAVGNIGTLSSLTTDAPGTTDLNGGTVNATLVNFQDDVILGANTTITGTTVTFGKTIDGQTPNADSLLVNASGTTTFDGAVGGSGALMSLTTDAPGTTDLNGRTVNAATVDFKDDVILTANTTVTASTVSFEKTVNDQTVNAYSLLVNASGTTTFGGAVGNTGALSNLTTEATGTTDLNGGIVNATNVDFKNNLILTANTTVTGTTVSFEKTVNDQISDAYSLLVNAGGTTTFGGAVGNTGALSSLTTDAPGTTDLNGGTVNATTVDFQDDVVLGANATVMGTTVTFEKTVNDQIANAYSLLVNAGGTTTFGGAIGNTGALSSLTTDAPGTTDLNGGSVNAATINFQDDLILTANTTITGTTVTFEKTVNDQTANAYSLLINASGTTTFDGPIGNTGAISSLTTDAPGTTDLNGGTVNATTVDFKDDVILTTNTTIVGTTVTFEKTVNDQTANAYSLLINASGTTTFDGAVGNTGVLSSLTTDATGTTDLNGGTINATTVDFKNDVILTTNTTITGTNITFEQTVNDQTANAYSLVINAIGTTTFDGAVGNTGMLSSLTTDAAGLTDLNGGTINATTVDFKDDVILTANTTITATTVTFEKTVNDQTADAYSLQLNATGKATFDGAIGNTGILSQLTVQSATDVLFNGTSATIHATDLSITNSGSTTFDGQATIDNTMLVQSGGNIVVNSAVSAAGANTAIDLQSGSGTGMGNVVLATTGSLQTTAVGSDILVQAGTTSGNITLMGSASNVTANDTVTLTASAGSITGHGTVTGTTVLLTAKTGINDGTASAGSFHTAAPNVSANNSGAFAVNIANSNAAATTVTSLTTVGANLTFTQAGGGDLAFTGTVTSGSPTINGGNIFLENSVAGSALTIATTATLSSAAGTGGSLTISGATIESTTAPIIGAGNITIIGGSLDTIVSSDLTVNATINISALRDVIIGAVVRMTNGVNSSLSITADTQGTGVGGVEVLSTGQLNSASTLTIFGSDLFATPTGLPDSVRIDAGGAGDRVVAAGDLTIASNAAAPAGSIIVLDGMIHSTGGNIKLDAKSTIQALSSITADVGSVDFQCAVELTGSMLVTAGSNVTFENTVNGDLSANDRTLQVNAQGKTTFDNAVGNTGILAALTILNSSDVSFNNASATIDATRVSITNTGSTTFNGAATIADSIVVDSGGNIVMNSAVSAGGRATAIDLEAGVASGTGSVTLTPLGSLLAYGPASEILVVAGANSGNIALLGTASDITAVDKVTLTAQGGSITGLGRLTAMTLEFSAATGINDGTAAHGGLLTNADTISADNTGAFVVNIANSHATLTTVTSLTTVGGDLTFTQSGGGDLTFTGLITSGSNTVLGGNIAIEDLVAGTALTIAGTATLSTASGFGGGLTISGATLDPTHPPIFGQGNITIIGGALDTIINSDLTLNGTITIAARRDVIIEAEVSTTINPNASINLTADTDANGVGGVEILSTGGLNSNKDINIRGSDVYATMAGPPDSVLVIGNGAPNQIIAVGNIAVSSTAAAPPNADVILDGQMTATTGTIFISAAQTILLGADLTVGTAFDFQQDVQLTSNVDLTSTGGGNITFERALTDAVNSTLTTNTIGNLFFQGNTHISTINALVEPNNITFGKLGGPAVTDVIANFADFENLGLLTIGLNVADSVTFLAGLTHTAGATSITGTLTSNLGPVTFGTVSLNGTVRTDAQAVSVGTMTLTGNSVIDTTFGNARGADVTFFSMLDATASGIQGLTLNTGSNGNILFTSPVGGGTRLGDLVIINSHNVTAQSSITCASLAETAGTGTTTFNFNGPVNTNTAKGVDLIGNAITLNSTLITTGLGGVVFTNAGLLTINGDILSDGPVTQNGAGMVSITTPGTRTITTSGDTVSFLQAVTLTGSGGLLSIDTTTGGKVHGGNVTFSNTLNSSSSAPHAERLLINAGTGSDILFVGAVGGNARLGDIIITDARNVTELGGLRAASLTQITGTGLTELNGAVDTNTGTGIVLTNGAITINNITTAIDLITLTAINPNGNITIDSTMQTTQPTGTVTLTSFDAGIVNGAPANVVNVIANSLVMQTVEGIGSSGSALQTQVANIAARNAGSGNIRVDNHSSQLLTITTVGGVNGISNVGPGQGDITVTNNASIMVSPSFSPTNGLIANATGGNITLMTNGGAFDITVNSPVVATGGNGNIQLQSGNNIIVNDTGVTYDISVVGTGTVYLTAANEVTLGNINPNTASNDTQFTTQNDVIIHTGTGSITNTLPLVYDVQSPQMTATGFVYLNMNVGRPGETNITVTVYWGDGSSTVTTFPNPGNYTFVHQYLHNPDTADKSAPILVNVQVAHDPHVVINALNVNTPTQSVPDIGVGDPPPVPTANINADLSSAIYNPNDPNYAALHTTPLQDKILQAGGSLDVPGVVVFQDTSIIATVIPVPGEGLSIFPFDTTPPVVYLHFPDRVQIVDSHEHAANVIVQIDSSRLEIAAAQDAVPTERLVFLEIYGADDSVERVRLDEKVLNDLFEVVGKLPDGRYRFLLQEPGETRQRVLLELFEVRQGKIVDENDTGDRPPSSGKKSSGAPIDRGPQPDANAPKPVDADDAASSSSDMSAVDTPQSSWIDVAIRAHDSTASGDESGLNPVIHRDDFTWTSDFGRRAWKRAERIANESVEQTNSADDQRLDNEIAAGGTTVSSGPGLSRGARLLRKHASSEY